MMPPKLLFPFLPLIFFFSLAHAKPHWTQAWPETDFGKSSISLEDVRSGGPPRDGIPSIDNPQFKPAGAITDIGPKEPVISVELNGTVRAYPIRVMMWHEIVNDRIGDLPIAVTYCPLCNASLVFDRRVNGRELTFGTSGLLRHSDMVMYDRQTDSLWQQYTGEAIVGEFTGTKLEPLASRLESFEKFQSRHAGGKVLIPNNPKARRYGRNPYVDYDSARAPFLYMGRYDEGIPPLARVVAIGDQAWPLKDIRKNGPVHVDGMVIAWSKGQNSALDRSTIRYGRDVGNITVTKNGEDVVHHLPFAFAFKAFNPEGVIHRVKN